MANKEPSLPAHHRWSDIIFHKIVIDFKAAVAQILYHRRVFVEEMLTALPRLLWGSKRGLARSSRARRFMARHKAGAFCRRNALRSA